ncbi:helix-turn-helix domain-containing protein [Pendulispora albinea]|uniref:Helix-turn-helix domain-containing protein n=2 Tax=Pendulispora albinea TaxID=2741071 RepID=A0ABZ2LQW4_9BACT
MTTARENYRYDECGLPNVTLRGVEVSRCSECGEIDVAISRIEKLHFAIAKALIERTERLQAVEIRFLRKWLGWSGTDLAQVMGVTKETVSRWENDKEPMGPIAERLLRMCVANLAPLENYSVDILKALQDTCKTKHLYLEEIGKDWIAAA